MQTHINLERFSKEYNTLFSKNEFYPIQKAYTTPHFLVLGIRFPGKSIALYIGRGSKYEGFFLSEKFPPSYLRIQDRFLDYARKYLVGMRIGKIEVDANHFLILFHYKTDHTDNSFCLGYKDHHLFFIKQNKNEIYTSWNGESISDGNILKEIDAFLGKESIKKINEANTNLKRDEWTIANYLEEEDKKISGKLLQKKKEKFLNRKILNIKNDLVKVEGWKEIEKELLKSDISLPDHECILHGQKIKFPSGANFWQKKDLVFIKIKKLKKAESMLRQRYQDTQKELELVSAGKFEFEVTKEKAIPILWKSTKNIIKKTIEGINVKNFKFKNLEGVISLDAASNDWIRSHYSKEFYWFHIENYSGAHCLLKTENIGSLQVEDFKYIASLLRDFSKLQILDIPIIYSQLKNIKGMKGSKGEVIIKKPKFMKCTYEKWENEIIFF